MDKLMDNPEKNRETLQVLAKWAYGNTYKESREEVEYPWAVYDILAKGLNVNLYDRCVAIYDAVGQSGVCDFVLAVHRELDWKYCEACDADNPVDDSACLVCGESVNI